MSSEDPGGTGEFKNASLSAPVEEAPAQTSALGTETPNSSDKSAREPEYVTSGRMFIIVILVSILSSMLAVFAYDRAFATKVVVFDLQGYLTKIRTDATEGKINSDQLKSRMDVLENTVLSVPKNTIIVTGDVVLGKNAKRLDVPGYQPQQ